MDIICKDLDKKLKDKCSESYFKKIIMSYDKKMEKCSLLLKENKELMEKRIFKLDDDLD